MKKLMSVLAVLCIMAVSVPVAWAGTSPSLFGFVYQDTTSPGDGFNAVQPARGGSATCRNIFYVVSIGNCSVKEAMKNGGITQLSHYDVHKKNILGFQLITVKAYGR